MAGWLARLMAAWRNKPPDNGMRAPPAGKPVAPVSAPTDAQDLAVDTGARRALLSADGNIAGFEFRMPPRLLARFGAHFDTVALAAHVSSLVRSAGLVTQAGNVGLARLPAHGAMLVDAQQVRPGVMLALQRNVNGPVDAANRLTAAIAALRGAGALVGWAGSETLSGEPDFVLLVSQEVPLRQALQQRAGWPPARRQLPLVVTDLADVADIEFALSQGARYVCGSLATPATPGETRDTVALPADARKLGQLLSQLVAGAETNTVAAQIKSDVGLTVRLIGRLNLATLSHIPKDGGVEQLVLLLGRNELYRWLSMLLLQHMGKRAAGSALQQTALWRARLMELLAMGRGAHEPAELFSLGLASMLGQLLHVSDAEVAQTMCLGPNCRAALLDQSGPLAAYLALVLSVENEGLPHALMLEPFGAVWRRCDRNRPVRPGLVVGAGEFAACSLQPAA